MRLTTVEEIIVAVMDRLPATITNADITNASSYGMVVKHDRLYVSEEVVVNLLLDNVTKNGKLNVIVGGKVYDINFYPVSGINGVHQIIVSVPV